MAFASTQRAPSRADEAGDGPLALLTRWNLVAEMYFSAFLAGLIIFGLWKIYRRSVGDDLLLFAPVAWFVCNLAQYENMLYGMMMCFYLTALGSSGRWSSLPGASSAACVSLWSAVSWPRSQPSWLHRMARGTFPAGGVERRLWWIALWVAGGLGSALLYFHNFQIAPNTHPVAINADGLYRVARFTLTLLELPWAPAVWRGAQSWDWY